MYSLLKMEIFHCRVSLPEGNGYTDPYGIGMMSLSPTRIHPDLMLMVFEHVCVCVCIVFVSMICKYNISKYRLYGVGL